MTTYVKERASRDPSWRCRLSYEGVAAHANHPASRVGRVIGESKDGQFWYVLWEGVGTPAKHHKAHIHVISRGVSA